MVCLVPTVRAENSDDQAEMDDTNDSDGAIADENEDDQLKLRWLAGGIIVDYPPLFSPDEESLLIVFRNVVQIYSATTGERLRDLEGASDEIVGLNYEPRNTKVVAAMTRSGELIRWKWKSGSVESKTKIKVWVFRVYSFHYVDLSSDSTAAFLTFTTGHDRNIEWAVVDTESGETLDVAGNLKLGRNLAQIEVENVYFHYVAAIQSASLIIQNYRNGRTKRWKNGNNVAFTIVRVHPNEEMVATGDKLGRIFLWRNIFDSVQPRTNLYHWHHTPVTSIAFTKSGTGFYSGGQESVLVQWNVDRPDLKNFLPRLGAFIVHIAVGPQNRKVAVSMADNGIQILDSQNNAKCIVQGFTYVYNDKTGLNKFPVGVKLNPRTEALVLNGRVGHIQFYSTHTRRLLYNMDIVMQNQLPIETGKVLYNTRVVQVAFNIDWMATVEEWNDQEHAPEVRLKFWYYDKTSQSYTLNTCIDGPHEEGVKAIEFSSSTETDNLLLATAGCDDYIKMWALEELESVDKKGQVWFCTGRTNYADFSVESISFSLDGSLIAAGFRDTLCIYKSQTLALKAALTAPARFMGVMNTVEVCISNEKVKKDTRQDNANKQNKLAEKKRILDLFKNYVENNDETLIQELRKKYENVQPKVDETKSQPRLQTPIKLTAEQKECLFKKIHASSDWSLFQKIDLYQKLNIYCTVPKSARKKLTKYIATNILEKNLIEQNLGKEANNLSNRYRFKAKYRVFEYQSRKANSDVNQKLVSIMSLLGLQDDNVDNRNRHADKRKSSNNSSHNGFKEDDVQMQEKSPVPVRLINPLEARANIKHLLFGTGEHAHLIVACFEHRVLIWNILTLRFESVLKLSTSCVAIDPITSLVAVFTINDQLYVFPPNAPMPLYHRVNVPKMYGAAWVPRRYPKSRSLNLNWQAISTLYFLTKDQALMYLADEKDDDASGAATTFMNEAQDIVQYSMFGAFATKQMNSKTVQSSTSPVGIGVPGKAAVKSLIEMATHTMAPNHLLCADFIESLLKTETEHKSPEASSKDKDANQETIISDSDESNDEVVPNKSKQSILEQFKKNNKYEYVDKTKRIKQREKLKRILKDDIDITF